MEFWTFVFAVVIASAIAKLIKSAIDHDQAIRVAKIEADLKLKLAERLRDPEMVRRIVEARLPANGEDVAAAVTAVASPPARPTAVPRRGSTGQLTVLVGLVSFLLGLALIAGHVFTTEELLVPGLVSSAFGLALLTWATSQRQIRRQIASEDPVVDDARTHPSH